MASDNLPEDRNEVPQPCENDCIMSLFDTACEQCTAYYVYWAEVDSSDMDIDWSEYADTDYGEWVEDGE